MMLCSGLKNGLGNCLLWHFIVFSGVHGPMKRALLLVANYFVRIEAGC